MGDVPLALVDGVVREVQGPDDGHDEYYDDDEVDLEYELELLLEGIGEDQDFPPVPPPPGSDVPAAPEPAVAAVPPPLPPPANGVVADGRLAVRRLRNADRWGCFLIVYKANNKFGGYQATCPFHEDTDTAKQCKKFLPIEGVHGDADCLVRIKAWCNRAKTFDRKRRHLRFVPGPGLDPAAVEAACIHDGPPHGDVFPDALLDKIEPA